MSLILGQDWIGNLRLKHGLPTMYEYLVVEEKLFTNMWNLYTFGLVYGILFKKIKKNSNRTSLTTITTISDHHIKDILSICYYMLDDGRPTNEIYNEMCDYSDGGVTELYKIFKENKTFNLPNLVRDAEKLWEERVKDLQNINLKK